MQASELDEAEGVLLVALPTRDEAAVVLQPGEEPFDLPTAQVATQRAAILGPPPAVRAVGSDQLDPALLREPFVQAVAVVGPVPDQAVGSVLEEAVVDRLLRERDLMRRSTGNPCGDRKTMAVRNCHDLGPLAALGLPDGGPPFFAPAKEPSIKASLISIPPRS